MKTHIFSYGSNMSHQRIQARVPSARFLTAGYLTHHELRWHKPSKDGSGKCDAFGTGVVSDVVWGGLFEISADEKYLLDKAEGLGIEYKENLEEIFCENRMGQVQVASTTRVSTLKVSLYKAIPIEPNARPYSWYKNFVVSGAIQCGLPASYISELNAVDDLADPDKARHAMNQAILHCEVTE